MSKNVQKKLKGEEESSQFDDNESDNGSDEEGPKGAASKKQQKVASKGRKDDSSDDDKSQSGEAPARQDRPASKQSSSAPADGKEVIVKGLSFQADENDIGNFLDEKFGSVSNVKLLRGDDGRSKGIAFITFDNDDDCEKAISGSNCDFMGRYLVIERTRPRGDRPAQAGSTRGPVDEESKTIFVGNLSFRTESDSLRRFFDSCGPIVDARIAQADGKSRGFGHVEFEERAGVEKALKKAGQELDGRPVKVDVAAARKREGGEGGRGGFGGGRGGSFGGGRGGSFGGGRGGSFGGGRGGRGGSRGGDFHGNDRRGGYNKY